MVDFAGILGLLHHFAHEPVGVELSKRAIEVIRAADRTARFHSREARDGRGRELTECFTIHVHQRVEEHLREFFVRHLAHGAATIHGGHHLLKAHLAAVGRVTVVTRRHTGGIQREVHVEHRFEHFVMSVVFHQRGTERSLQRGPVVQRDELDRAHRVEVLGHAHGETRGA